MEEEQTKRLPLRPRKNSLPSVEEIARAFEDWRREDFWDFLRTERNTRDWVEGLEEEGHSIMLLETVGWECVSANRGRRCGMKALLEFFAIDAYVPKTKSYNQEASREEWFWNTFLVPLCDLVNRALRSIAPPDIPGRFSIMLDPDFGYYIIVYYEGSTADSMCGLALDESTNLEWAPYFSHSVKDWLPGD